MKKLLVSLLIPLSISAMATGFDTEIKARQDSFSAIKDNVEAVGEMLENGEFDYNKFALYGGEMVKHSARLKELFPEGSREGSDAKKAIWKNINKFNKGLDKLNKGFEDFHAGALAQDKAATLAGFEQATGTCKACHRKFRVKR